MCPWSRMCSKISTCIKHRCLPVHQKQRNKPCFRSLVFFLNNILPILHLLNMFIMVSFHLCPHESLKIQNFYAFIQKCNISKITHLLFIIVSNSRLLISITLRRAYAIPYTYVDCCTSTYTFVDGYTFAPMTFSSLTPFYVVRASTKCCSTILSSLNFSMNTISTHVALSQVCSFTCQCLLLLRKNSTTYVLVVFIS